MSMTYLAHIVSVRPAARDASKKRAKSSVWRVCVECVASLQCLACNIGPHNPSQHQMLCLHHYPWAYHVVASVVPFTGNVYLSMGHAKTPGLSPAPERLLSESRNCSMNNIKTRRFKCRCLRFSHNHATHRVYLPTSGVRPTVEMCRLQMQM